MEAAVKQAGVQFGLGFQRNFSNAIWKAKEYIEEGRLGRPIVAHSDSVAQIRPKRVMHDANGNMGPVMDLGCHFFIMWQTIFQSLPKTVYARGQVLAKDREELSGIERLAIDTAEIIIEYESGDVGVFTVTWGLPPQCKLKAQVDRMYGPKGAIEGGLSMNNRKIKLYEGAEMVEVDIEAFPSLHAKQFEVFVDALDAGLPAPVSFQQGRDVLALTLAIFRSIETQAVVDYRSFYEEMARS